MNTLDYIVNKYKINLDDRYIIEIPNMGRDNMAELFAELNFNIGAEIGVFKGKYSEVLCKANPNLKLYGIDAWEISAHPPGIFVGGETQELFDGFYEESKKRMTPYKNYTFVKKLSMDAVKDFEDQSLDFVYIDAGHDFMSFTEDLHWWLKKIKIGGIMSGHDYARYPFVKMIHVKRVLEAYAWSYKMLPFFVIGAEEYKEEIIRDRYRSWMWVKDKHYV